MSDIAVRVTNISKKFSLKKERDVSVKESFFQSSLLGSFPSKSEEFWALKDVSFDVSEGECVGIIGMNGAGKSTLLKILSDIIRPTSGNIEISGQLAAILELGVGFHPELSGRDNILLYGKTLGFSNSQILSKFEEIVEFSEIRTFIDNPIKHYSSGMLMRLGFAVIAFLESDIILLDEVLSVGDIGFRNKCINKIVDLKNQKKTIIIVSHDLNEISNYCDRIILIHEGNLIASGTPTAIFDKYQQILSINKEEKSNPLQKKYKKDYLNSLNESFLSNLKNFVNFEESTLKIKSPSFDLISASLSSRENLCDEKPEFYIDSEIFVTIKARYNGQKSDLAFIIRDTVNNKIFADFIFSEKNMAIEKEGVYEFKWKIPPHIFNEGIFKFGINLFDEHYNTLFSAWEVLLFRTIDKNKNESQFGFFSPVKPLIKFNYDRID